MQSLWKTQKQCLLKLDVSVPCGPRHIPNRNAYIHTRIPNRNNSFKLETTQIPFNQNKKLVLSLSEILYTNEKT